MAAAKRRFGLKARFTSLIVGLLTLIFAAITVVLLQVNTTSLRVDLLERSKAFAALATKPIGNTYLTYQDSGTALIGQQISNFVALDKNITNVGVFDLSGKITYSLNPGSAAVTQADAESFEPIYKYGANGAIQQVIYPFIEDGGRHSYGIVYTVSSTTIDQAVERLTGLILLYSLIGLLISAAVTYFLINRLFLRPIQQVSEQAIIISRGYYSEKIDARRNDEIGDLAASVNQMAGSLRSDLLKLQEVDKIKTEFMMIASHNLRTPLTIINGYLELVRAEALSDELTALVSSIEANSQRLGMFAEDLLIMSNIEAGENIFRMESLSADKLTEGLVSEFTVLSADKQVVFNTDIDTAGLKIRGSKLHLRSALWNLLDNALKFTAEGGTVELTMRQVGDKVQAIVKDTGTGISVNEQSKLFTKFHRGTSTEIYNYEGTGIGLYIAKLIIDAHDGSISVDSTLGKGTAFTILLPLESITETSST